MKNIEKYKETKDALEAYNSFDFKRVPFDIWLEYEYEAPREPTLLEAAEAVVDEWYTTDVSGGNIMDLKNAIAREKAKPVSNFDRFATSEAAVAEFLKTCDRGYELFEDVVTWLYAEAGKEDAK